MDSWKGKNKSIAIASDHAGFRLKAHVIDLLTERELAVTDLGPMDTRSVDYPDFAALVSQGVSQGRYEIGILICKTGIGMTMCANRFRNVRAALCCSSTMARMARAHNDANVLCMGDWVTGVGVAEDILKEFLGTDFEGGRHLPRVQKIDALFSQEKP